MRRTRTIIVGLTAFTAGLIAAWMLPNATAQESSRPSWSFENGRFFVENTTDQAYLIIGYSESGAAEAAFSIALGETSFAADAATSYYSYPISISAVEGAVALPSQPMPDGRSIVGYGPCLPAICGGPPGCGRCPPITPTDMAALRTVNRVVLLQRRQ